MQRKDHSSSNQEATRICKITLIPRSQRIAAARTSTPGVWSHQTCLSVSETCDHPCQNRWKGFEVTDPSTADCIELPCSRERVRRLSFFGKHVSQLQTQLSDPKQGTGSSRVRSSTSTSRPRSNISVLVDVQHTWRSSSSSETAG